MPFQKRAEVALRNDTDRNAMSYFYLEWENLPKRVLCEKTLAQARGLARVPRLKRPLGQV